MCAESRARRLLRAGPPRLAAGSGKRDRVSPLRRKLRLVSVCRCEVGVPADVTPAAAGIRPPLMLPLCSASRVQDGIVPPSQASVYELSGAVGPRQIPRQLAFNTDLQRQRVEQVIEGGRKCGVCERRPQRRYYPPV